MKDILVSINKERLTHNISTIRTSLPQGTLLCAVVKSDAYGHGAKRICEVINKDVDYFAVANNYEAFNIKRRYPNKPVLILGAFSTHYLKSAIKYGAEISIFNKEHLSIISKTAKKLKKQAFIHVQVNSGMNRLGLNSISELSAFYDELKKHKNITLIGIYSHLGSGDIDCKRNYEQISQFQKFINFSPLITIKHLCNSSFYYKKPCFDLVRVGIAIYGYNFPNTLPILNIKARVVAINHIKKGDYIGYTNQNKATKDITTATLSIGYADGLPRLWAKRGYCIINGKKCPIVGNICMNMTIVLVDKNVKVNDYATIIGKDGDLELTATEIAKQCKTIEYEILTNFKKI